MGEGDLHRYRVTARWRGSTGDGWAAYDRSHEVRAEPAEQTLGVTTGESHGDPSKLNPEQLLVAAACSCQLLWFLHLAAKARVEVLEYDDHAEGLMRVDERPASVTEIMLRPRIVVAEGPSRERVRRLAELAHDECYIANSLKSDVRVEPRVELAAR